MRDINYKFIGQLYGILSKVSFMIDSGRYNISLEEKASYNHIIEMWEESGSVLKSDLDVLVDMIYDCTNSKYWYDEDECYVIDDTEDDDFDYDNDYCDCGECPCDDDDKDIITGLTDKEKDELKELVKQLGIALDDAANNDIKKPFKFTITFDEEE